jgi:flagella basal body P-ring formation protein FlgA
VALAPGTIGEDVSVRNAETGVTIRGVVGSDGSVQVEGSR